MPVQIRFVEPTGIGSGRYTAKAHKMDVPFIDTIDQYRVFYQATFPTLRREVDRDKVLKLASPMLAGITDDTDGMVELWHVPGGSFELHVVECAESREAYQEWRASRGK